MAHHEAPEVEDYRTKDGNRVFRYSVNGAHVVAFIYADHSPQFIHCDTQAEADRLFVTSMENAVRRGNIFGVGSTAR